MAVGESTATTGTPGDVVSTYTIDTLDGVTVTERELQLVRLAYVVGLGDAVSVGPTNPLPVASQSGSETALTAGEQVIGATVGKLSFVRPVFTISAAAYAAGRVIGGEVTLTGAMRLSGGSGMLHTFMMVDAANVKPEMRCIIFDQNPAGSFANNTTMTINSADFAKIVGDFYISPTDWITYDNSATDFAIATLANMGMLVKATGSADLYAVFVTIGAPTFTSTTQLSPAFGFIQN